MEELRTVNVRNNTTECLLEISLPMLLKHYRDRRIWDSVLFELFIQLQKDHKTFYRIEDEREAEGYCSYPESTCLLEAGVLSFTNPNPKLLFSDLVGSVWSYDGILKIFCCSENKALDNYSTDYLFTIAPFNDGESIVIGYSSDEIARQLMQKIIQVIESFGLFAEFEENGKTPTS